MKSLPIHALYLIHIAFWFYVVFGSFLGPEHAKRIRRQIIPVTYILHTIFPFHVLMKMKEMVAGESHGYYRDMYESSAFMQSFSRLNQHFEKVSAFNPISPQGLLVLSLLVSNYVDEKGK